jgi:hypothetical protein
VPHQWSAKQGQPDPPPFNDPSTVRKLPERNMPFVCTVNGSCNWTGVSEIDRKKCGGFLIQPKNASDIRSLCIKRLESETNPFRVLVS